jgi:hypothetical protein
MGMRAKRKRDKLRKDKITKKLLKQGIYTVSADSRFGFDDWEFRKFDAKVGYSFWSAVKYTFILSILLCWLPTFGQMIAGYVGGRRAGSPWKGAIAAAVPVVLLVCLTSMWNYGYFSIQAATLSAIPALITSTFTTYVPFLMPYLKFSIVYFKTFIMTFRTSASASLGAYVVTVVFAYIGGIMADQNRREAEASNTVPTKKSVGLFSKPSYFPRRAQYSLPSRATAGQQAHAPQYTTYEQLHSIPFNGNGTYALPHQEPYETRNSEERVPRRNMEVVDDSYASPDDRMEILTDGYDENYVVRDYHKPRNYRRIPKKRTFRRLSDRALR